jgi:hypothetical protein
MSHGDSRHHGRDHVGWVRLRAAMDRFVDEQRTRQADDNPADRGAARFTESIEEAVLQLENGEHGFDRADRKAGHVEELRRVLGLLLDILADWELAAGCDLGADAGPAHDARPGR